MSPELRFGFHAKRSVQELKQAVNLMSHHQRGIDLTDDELVSIVAYLGSLTGELERNQE